MRLEKASYKAIRYACMNFHYAKSVPNVGTGYSVFNQNNQWCGCICFGVGATNLAGVPYGLRCGEIIELLRVALNGEQGITSNVVATSIKLLKKQNPLVKMIVSYADSEQQHLGIIYQAMNFYYVGFSVDSNLIVNGKREHRRSISGKYGTNSKDKLEKMGLKVERIVTKPKYKYIYPLDKSLISLCKKLSKPYPKSAEVAHKGE